MLRKHLFHFGDIRTLCNVGKLFAFVIACFGLQRFTSSSESKGEYANNGGVTAITSQPLILVKCILLNSSILPTLGAYFIRLSLIDGRIAQPLKRVSC